MLFHQGLKSAEIRSPSFQGAMRASGVMAFTGLGDAMLYPILPIYGKEMGFPVFIIGLLLSVNRFVRILANTFIANVIEKSGMKRVQLTCALLAVFTTLLYGIDLGIFCFFVARLLWGLSYSGLKISTLNYAAQVKHASGLAFGLSRSIQSSGGLFALWFCPTLMGWFGFGNGFLVLALISSIGILIALSLPSLSLTKTPKKIKAATTFNPTYLNLLVFMLSVTLDGILVVALSSLLVDKYPDTDHLLAAVAFYLLLKRIFVFIFSSLAGWFTTKIPATQLFNLSVVVCILALLLIAYDLVVYGIVVGFLFNTIVVAFSPLVAIRIDRQSSLQAISSVSTWWDLGAALGAFFGIYLVEELGTQNLFLLLSLVLSFTFIKYFMQNGATSKEAV